MNISLLTTAVAGMSLYMGIQLLVLIVSVEWTRYLWTAFGFLGTSGILAYAALSQWFVIQLSGRVTTAVNLLVFVAAFVGQWAIGASIDLWPVNADGSCAPAGYRMGFAVMLSLQVIALVWFFISTRIIKHRAS